jgi:hypothetical protein
MNVTVFHQLEALMPRSLVGAALFAAITIVAAGSPVSYGSTRHHPRDACADSAAWDQVTASVP